MFRLGFFVMVVIPCFCSGLVLKGNRNLTGGDVLRDCPQGLLGTYDGTCNCRKEKPFFHVLNNETYGCTTSKKVCQGKSLYFKKMT